MIVRHCVLDRCVVLGLTLSLALVALPSRAQDPETTLRAKGLAKRGVAFCLPAEVELSKAISGPRSEAFRKKKAADESQAATTAAQTKLDDFEKQVLKWRQGYDAMNVQYTALSPTSPQASRLAQQINQLVALLNAAPTQMEQAEKALKEQRAASAQSREEFIQYVLKLRQQLSDLEAEYQKLGADPEVKKALEEANQAGKRFALGPAKSTLEAIRRLEGSVITDAIPIHHSNDRLWRLYVTINERKPQEMAIDTGASLVVVPHKMAQDVGLYVSGDAPKVQLQLADGKTVIEAQLVTAPTIRVGRFTAKNVRCAVLPPNLPDAMPLLGMSFLGQYNFKIDKEQSKLVLATVGGTPAGRGGKPSADAPAAASAPAETASAPAEPGKAKSRTEQLSDLLTLPPDEAEGRKALTAQGANGKALIFHPAKQGPIKTLQERFGDPDEIRKIPGPRDAADAEPAPWKLWAWGSVLVIVDETGSTRYFGVREE
jgi:clan AA aspartic protease (TIGR02281 family)